MDYINLILENWQIIGGVLLSIIGLLFGAKMKSKVLKLIQAGQEIYKAIQILFRDLNLALEDKHIDKQELKKIRDDLKEIRQEVYNVFYLFNLDNKKENK